MAHAEGCTNSTSIVYWAGETLRDSIVPFGRLGAHRYMPLPFTLSLSNDAPPYSQSDNRCSYHEREATWQKRVVLCKRYPPSWQNSPPTCSLAMSGNGRNCPSA